MLNNRNKHFVSDSAEIETSVELKLVLKDTLLALLLFSVNVCFGFYVSFKFFGPTGEGTSGRGDSRSQKYKSFDTTPRNQ
jgi:hypothetical protein